MGTSRPGRWLVVLLALFLVLAGARVALAAVPWSHGTDSDPAACATSSTTVFTASTVANALILFNDSDTRIWVKFDGTAAVVGKGWPIDPASGIYLHGHDAVPNAAITCIHGGTGTKNLYRARGAN